MFNPATPRGNASGRDRLVVKGRLDGKTRYFLVEARPRFFRRTIAFPNSIKQRSRRG